MDRGKDGGSLSSLGNFISSGAASDDVYFKELFLMLEKLLGDFFISVMKGCHEMVGMKIYEGFKDCSSL